MATKELKILPEDFLDNVWGHLSPLSDDSSRDELLEATDAIADMFNEYDPERFPLIVDGELGDDEDEDDS